MNQQPQSFDLGGLFAGMVVFLVVLGMTRMMGHFIGPPEPSRKHLPKPVAKVVTVPGGADWHCAKCGIGLKPGEQAVKIGAKVYCVKCARGGNPAQLQTVYITKEAQRAMLELVKRAKGKKAEYQLELLLEGNKVYPGASKWGAPERLRAYRTGIGVFHTHPTPLRAELSSIDLLHLLISPHRIIGVAKPETYLVKTVPYGLEETADVQFAALVEEVSPESRRGFLDIMPMVVALSVPVENIEHYFRLYEFSLGPMAVPVEVLV